MEILLATLIAFLVLAAFDFAALEWGVDSRREFDDPHAPLAGAA
jgi:hypothetical protein